MSVSDRSTVVAVKDHVSCDLAGEAVLLDLEAGVYYGLNAVGTRIWQLIQQPQTVEAIRDALLREYDVDGDRCGRDVLALLNDLASKRLIEVSA